MEHSQLIEKFIGDLQIEGCNVQAGTVTKIMFNLTPENATTAFKSFQGIDTYFLGGVPQGLSGRAKDSDIIKKGHFFLDFDIRSYWKQEYDEELPDNQVKEIGIVILESLKTHNSLRHWRYGVFTGNGLHVHFFGEAVPVTSSDAWKKGMQLLLKHANSVAHIPADKSCINVSRICRLPGTANCKKERHIETEFIGHQPAEIFDLSLIERAGNIAEQTTVQSENKQQGQTGKTIPEGGRNSALTSLAGSLRHRGLPEDVVREAVMSVNKTTCNPPLPDSEVLSITKSISRYTPNSKKQDISQAQNPVVLKLSEVERESVEWLWDSRIPRGKLTLFEGDPGTGKSWCCCAIIKALTTGEGLPGDTAWLKRAPSNVLILTAEDGLGDTIRPRLEDMGADISKVHALTGVKGEGEEEERHLSLATDLQALETALSREEYSLVVIDPLNAYLGSEVDTHRDAAIRSVLTPITRLAERHDVSILAIRHLTKSMQGKAMYRGIGSIGFTGAARVVHLIGANPHNEDERVIACVKNNLAAFPKSIAYEVKDGRFKWNGEVDVTAEQLGSYTEDAEAKSAFDEATEFLIESLSMGPVKATEIMRDAKSAGVSERTLNRAKRVLNIQVHKEKTTGGPWMWEMPVTSKVAKVTNEEWQPSTSEAPVVSSTQLTPLNG